MAKDPAFLFYYANFQHGTRKMTFEEKGCYIELLCEQADSGHLSIDDIKRTLKDHFPIWDSICHKFDVDKGGLYYNSVLKENLEKRRKYVVSRKNNLESPHKDIHMDSHMGNHKININKNEDRKEKKIYSFDLIWSQYPNKDGKKQAEKHFKASVLTEDDFNNIKKALKNYMEHLKVNPWKKPKNGSTWFNNWKDWVDWVEPECTEHKDEPKKQVSGRGAPGALVTDAYLDSLKQ